MKKHCIHFKVGLEIIDDHIYAICKECPASVKIDPFSEFSHSFIRDHLIAMDIIQSMGIENNG